MEQKYDVGIYGLWYGNNYGSIITYYALSKVMELMGKTCAMIHNPLGSDRPINTLRRSDPLRFASEHYEITPLYTLKEMKKLNDMFDTFILGSDQMWNYHLSKPFGYSYYLDFVDNSKIKVAYATSFGRDHFLGPDEEKPTIQNCLQNFDAISVRDDFSKVICESTFQTPATIVLDPVFLCPKEKYEDLIAKSDFHVEEDFIFAYILDPEPVIGSAIQSIAEETGKKVIVAFNETGNKDKLINTLKIKSNNVEYLREPTINEWLYLYKNSSFVVTDSFHGSCFSIIFGRPFIALRNNKRGGSRFSHLLGGFGLLDYMVTSPKEIADKFRELGINHKVDYKSVYERVNEEKNHSMEWLKKALSTHAKKPVTFTNDVSNAVTSILQKDMCTGCGACISVCPVSALVLRKDDFGYYRSDIDREKCINCGRCSKICPALNLPENKNNSDPACYAFYAADSDLLMQSSSGGAFSLLAQEAFRRGGAVVGAAWRDDFTVEHIIVEDPSDLYKLQKSKYMQSYTGSIDRDIKILLDQGRFVLFSGCPCQISGLKAYLKEDYANLILVDLLCGNAPSAAFFKKYLKDEFPDGIAEYEFRNKFNGWNANCVSITTKSGTTIIRRGGEQDAYQAAYHSHTMTPHHCEKCRYQTLPRFGDITIGDFWGISKFDAKMRNTDGTSVVLCNNQKGQEFFDRIPTAEIGQKNKVPLEWVGSNGYMKKGAHNFASPNRDKFYSLINTMSFSDVMDYITEKKSPSHYKKAGDLSPLHYDVAQLHFHCDDEMLEESFIKGVTVLTAKSSTPPPKKYACLKLLSNLKQGHKYRFSICFKIKSSAPQLYFHIKETGTSHYQIIYRHKITAQNAARWVELAVNFTANSSLYDEFMVAASQIRGEDSFLAIDYINITEIKS